MSKKAKILIVVLLTLILSSTSVFAQSITTDGKKVRQQTIYTHYKIIKGDSLWRISKEFGVSIKTLRETNGIKGSLIRTGEYLKIPKPQYVIQSENGLRELVQIEDGMSPGDRLTLAAKAPSKPQVTITSLSVQNHNFKKSDRYWLAKIIEAEAGIESLKGKIAVGAVVLNRVKHGWFPDTIKGVIFQKFRGVYQFSPVGDGRIYEVKPSKEAFAAADRALAGEDPTNGALYFYNPQISNSKFFKKKQVVVTIGNHEFFN